MFEMSRLFWEKVLLENIVFIYFFGALLVLVEAQGVKKSLVKGVKFSLSIALASLIGWMMQFFLFTNYNAYFLWVFLLASLFAVWVLRKWGELKDEWMGMPGFMLVLGPMMGLQILVFERATNGWIALILILGAGLGFYLAFILVASMGEQIKLSESSSPFKGHPPLLLAMGIIALALLGFRFL